MDKFDRDVLFALSCILGSIELYIYRIEERSIRLYITFICILIMILAINRLMGTK